MAQLRCCTAPELLCSHLYKSDAIDIERIDTSIREKHAKQLGFFPCAFALPWLFFSLHARFKTEGRYIIPLFDIRTTYIYLLLMFFPWQKHTQHGIKMMISITVVNHLMCV